MNINTNVIEKYLEFSINELMDHSLVDILNLEKKALRLEEDDRYLNNLKIQDQFFRLFKDYELFCKLFSKEYVDKYLLREKLEYLVDKQFYVKSLNMKQRLLKHGVYINDEYQDIVIRPNRTRTTHVCGEVWMIPSKYQDLKHEKIIKRILREKYYWIYTCKFELTIYGISKETDNFYLEANDYTLYIPWIDFVNVDIDKIKAYNLSYHKSFPDNNPVINEFFELMKGGEDMEKYAVDMSELPVTDDQIRTLRKISSESFVMPTNRKQADEMIEKLAGENNDK